MMKNIEFGMWRNTCPGNNLYKLKARIKRNEYKHI
jgi:hypothetical protein